MFHYRFEEVEVDAILALRTRVLRPHYDDGELAHFGGDDEESTRHFALVAEDEEVAAIVTYMAEPAPFAPDEPAVRLRGMAVDAALRGRGLGTRLMDATLPRLSLLYPDSEVVWCNAREHAVPFYEKHGFLTRGEPFDVERIGPHVVMHRPLPALT